MTTPLPAQGAVLVCAPTLPELAAVAAQLGADPPKQQGHPAACTWQGIPLLLLYTGLGQANTAWWLGQALARHPVRLVVHTGIAGSYNTALLPIGSAAEVVQDSFAQLGAEAADGSWLPLAELGFPLAQQGSQPVYQALVNPSPSPLHLPKVTAITADTAHGTAQSLARMQQLYQPQLESMETAAVLLAGIHAGVPVWAFRGISNAAEPRNRDAWNIPAGLAAAAQAVQLALQAIV